VLGPPGSVAFIELLEGDWLDTEAIFGIIGMMEHTIYGMQ
jgi:hypothetical protein